MGFTSFNPTYDFENVLATMGSTLSNIGIAKATSSEIVRTTLNSLSNTALDSVAHNNYQLESMAANLLGSAVQYGAQKGMEAFSSSHYEAAQRGETVKPNNASRLNGTNAGNRIPRNQSASQLPHQTSRAPTTAYFSDPLLDADFAEILDPRINVNNPNNAQRLGNGVANINRQTYLQSQGHAAAAQQTQQRVSTTSRVLNALNAAGNSQLVASFNQTVEALRDAPGNELLSVYRDVRGGNVVDGLARGALDVMSVLPQGRLARASATLLESTLTRGVERFGVLGRGSVSANSMEKTFEHPLEGWTPQEVVQQANKLGVQTSRDQLILWSGLGRDNIGVGLSQEYAAANGGITLEMTPGGKWLNSMDLYGPNSPFTRVEAGRIWESISTLMIQQASGQVRSLIGAVNPSSIYRAEQSELLMNNKILGLDELNLKPRYGFKNN